MNMIQEFALELSAIVFPIGFAHESDLIDQDEATLREQCEDDLHRHLSGVGVIMERKKSNDTDDE